MLTIDEALDRIGQLVDENKKLKERVSVAEARAKHAQEYAEIVMHQKVAFQLDAEFYKEALKKSRETTQAALDALKF